MRNFFGRRSVERAPYALPPGSRALEDGPFGTRRAFFLSAAGAMGLVGSAGFLLGRTSSTTRSEAELAASLARMELAWARALARGPIEELLTEYVGYLSIVDLPDSDAVLWLGVERLAQAALLQEGVDTKTLLDRLLVTLRNANAPSALSAHIPALEQRARSLGERE